MYLLLAATALAAAAPVDDAAIIANPDGTWTITRDIEAEPETLAWIDETPATEEGVEETESEDDLRDAFEEAIDMARHPD